MTKKRIFIACPIGEDASEARKRSDLVFNYLITPAVQTTLPDSHELIRADTIGQPGRISHQILKELRDADIVIADLSDLNANVLYEFGIRQALLRPYVLLAQKGQKLPFDLTDLRTIFYELDLTGADRARQELVSHLQSAISGAPPAFDAELFTTRTPPVGAAKAADEALFSLADSFTGLRESQNEIRDLIHEFVAYMRDNFLNAEARHKKDQEQQIGMMFLAQAMQDPKRFAEFMPMLETFARIGAGQNISDAPQPKKKRNS